MSKAAGGGSALVGTAAAATLAVLSTGLVVSIAYRYLRHKQVCSLVHRTITTAALVTSAHSSVSHHVSLYRQFVKSEHRG